MNQKPTLAEQKVSSSTFTVFLIRLGSSDKRALQPATDPPLAPIDTETSMTYIIGHNYLYHGLYCHGHKFSRT